MSNYFVQATGFSSAQKSLRGCWQESGNRAYGGEIGTQAMWYSYKLTLILNISEKAPPSSCLTLNVKNIRSHFSRD